MDSNLPIPPKDVATLRTELERGRTAGTLFMSVWALERYAFTTLEWADTLAKQVADQIATILDLRSQLRDAQEIAQGLVAKAEQWQKQLEWHYEGEPRHSRPVIGVLGAKDSEAGPQYMVKLLSWSPLDTDWWMVGEGWLAKMPTMQVLCWQEVNLPVELQIQDTNE